MSVFKKIKLLPLILVLLFIFCSLQSALVSAENGTAAQNTLHHKNVKTHRRHHVHHVHHLHHVQAINSAANKKDNVQFTIEPNNTVVAKNVAIPEDAAAEHHFDKPQIPINSKEPGMPPSIASSIEYISLPENTETTQAPEQEEFATQAVKSKPLDLAEILPKPSAHVAKSKAAPAYVSAPAKPPAAQPAQIVVSRQPATLPDASVHPSAGSAESAQSASLPDRLMASLRQLSKKPVVNAAPVPVKAQAPRETQINTVAPVIRSEPQRSSISVSAKTLEASNSASLPARLMASLRQLRKPAATTQNPPAPTTAPTPTTVVASEPAYLHKKSMFGDIAASMHRHLVDFIQKTVSTLHYSNYKLGGSKFDTRRGVYITDCSGFVDNILRKASPHAYSSLVNATGALTPATQHYYNFFQELSDNSDNYWNKVDDVDQLRAGDILVFRYKNSRGGQTGGHVMVVMDKPVRDTNVYFVRVADSAPSRHSEDTRQIHEGGIGIGTLLLKASKSGRPAAYAWGIGGLWNKNVNFAMARPMDWD